MTAVAPTIPSHWWSDRLEVGREAALFCLNVAAVLALGRLFVGTDHLGPLLLTAAVAHGLLMGLRRTGRSLALATLLTPIAAFITLVLLFEPGSTILGIPTSSSVRLLGNDLDAAFSLFGDTPTPAEPVAGFLILCAAALWLSAFVADWAAFRLDLAVEALLPAGTIFIFAAVLADDRQRTFVTVVATMAALTFFLMHRVARQVRTGHWLAGSSSRGSVALVGTGTVILVGAVLAATLSGPSLPGAGSTPLVQLEPSNNAPQSRVTVSPLVDIRRRLVEQANVEVFQVKSDVRAYWRLTALDSFDGRIWSSSGSYGRAEGTLQTTASSRTQVDTVTQTFDVNALAAIWLPAAFEPRSIEADLDLRYDELSSTLIVDTDILDSDGVTYTVESDLPRFDPAALSSAIRQYPRDITESQLDLPDGFPDSVRQLAAEVASAGGDGADTYTEARRLQDFLRGFTYDLAVPSGHGDNDLERFLLQTQTGYCEQFAGSFAAMARSLGIPSRVAVGFTPGIEIEPGVFSVRGEHAHAWPEVYFAGMGWVPFEPTPGRGAPGAEGYTGVDEQQVLSGGNPNTATSLPTATTQPGSQTAQPGDEAAIDTVEPVDGSEATLPDGASGSGTTRDLGAWLLRAAIGLGAVLIAAVLYVIGALLIDHRRRLRRRRAAETPTARVQLAWAESLERLSLIGFQNDPSATHDETAGQASAVLPTGAEHARTIGVLAEATVYGPSAIGDEEAETAERAAGEIGEIVHAVTSATARSRRALNPKTVLGVGPIRRIDAD